MNTNKRTQSLSKKYTVAVAMKHLISTKGEHSTHGRKIIKKSKWMTNEKRKKNKKVILFVS